MRAHAHQLLTADDVEEAYRRGIAHAEAELLPFRGVGRVKFDKSIPQFAATAKYERELLNALRGTQQLLEDVRGRCADDEHKLAWLRDETPARVQRAGSAARRAPARVVRRGRERWKAEEEIARVEKQAAENVDWLRNLDEYEGALAHDLEGARTWLDGELDERNAYAAIRTGLRRETDILPNAVAYASQVFYDEDRQPRELGIDPGRNIPGGAYYGDKWTWELPERPWQVTRWSLFWLDNGEIFAVDRTFGGDPDVRPARDPDQEILLLGRVPRPKPFADDFLASVQASVRRDERNTLLVAGRAIGEQQRLHERRLLLGAEE